MITGVTPANTGSASPRPAQSNAEKANLDYSAFLRLFVASMKNQDPTKPNDPSQTLSQLATFSNVEQSIKMNDKLDRMAASSAAAVAASMIGKRLTSLDGAVSGLVTGVENSRAGLAAMLQDGTRFELSSGYKIVAP